MKRLKLRLTFEIHFSVESSVSNLQSFTKLRNLKGLRKFLARLNSNFKFFFRGISTMWRRFAKKPRSIISRKSLNREKNRYILF